jgi:hypothetical protein
MPNEDTGVFEVGVNRTVRIRTVGLAAIEAA